MIYDFSSLPDVVVLHSMSEGTSGGRIIYSCYGFLYKGSGLFIRRFTARSLYMHSARTSDDCSCHKN
uniref:Uncharacterized protein n=1 Tax=Anguilla anguilla TaxID=7936 RepID=A0A0E9WP73_ANGAN